MAVSTQVLESGPRNTIIKVFFTGDVGGDLTDSVIYDASAYSPITTNDKLRSVFYNLNGFDAVLYWDANTNVPIISLDQGLLKDVPFFPEGGGLPNNGGAGRTGDILMTTNGLTTGNDGYIILYVNKREVPKER
jgi:hypothetical protein